MLSNFFGNKRLFILLFSLILLVILMGLTVGERSNPSWPEKFVRDTVALAQGVLYKPANAISGLFENVKRMYNIYEENRILKANLDRLAQLSAEVKRLQSENERLRDLLDAKSNYNDYKLSFAEVIGRSPDRWNNVIIIDRGEKDGIKPGMAVMTAKGMIGRIQSVSNFSSQVELLSDIERGSYISAVVQGNNEIYGVIEGYQPKQNYLVMRKIPLGAGVEEKQMIITSGLGDPAIPSGLVIGEVVKVGLGDYGLTQEAFIKPSADFYRLSQVFVVERSTPGQGEGRE